MDIRKTSRQNLAYYNLATYIIKSCFNEMVLGDSISSKIKYHKSHIDFAKNSKLLKLWADCSESFSYDRIKKEIIKYNNKKIEEYRRVLLEQNRKFFKGI